MLDTNLVHQPGLEIGLRTGKEGPSHDPYAWKELCVAKWKVRLTLHTGLVDWVMVELWDEEVDSFVELQTHYASIAGISGSVYNELFIKWTGYTYQDWEKFGHRCVDRRIGNHYRDNHDVVDMDGYPGESILYCKTCDKVIDCNYDNSWII